MAIVELIVGGLIGFLSAVFAEPFRRRVFAPKLRINFDNSDDLVSRNKNPSGRDYIYVRGLVTNDSTSPARNARAYLTYISRFDDKNGWIRAHYRDSIQLRWSARPDDQKFSAVELPKGLEQCVDLIKLEIGLLPELQLSNLPARYKSLIDKPGKYQFNVLVTADYADSISKSVTIEISEGFLDAKVVQ